MMSKQTSVKARRQIQIRKLENELMKLQKRYDQITDPVYISELRGKLKVMEGSFIDASKNTNKLEIQQVLLDKQINHQLKVRD